MPTAVEDWENVMNNFCRCSGCRDARDHDAWKLIQVTSLAAFEEVLHA
jgi:hypothetical protein